MVEALFELVCIIEAEEVAQFDLLRGKEIDGATEVDTALLDVEEEVLVAVAYQSGDALA